MIWKIPKKLKTKLQSKKVKFNVRKQHLKNGDFVVLKSAFWNFPSQMLNASAVIFENVLQEHDMENSKESGNEITVEKDEI